MRNPRPAGFAGRPWLFMPQPQTRTIFFKIDTECDSGRENFSRHATSLKSFDVDDPGILADVDTPADVWATS